MNYKISQCLKCGQIMVTSAKVLKCVYCNKTSRKFKVIKTFTNPKTANLFCLELKEEIIKEKLERINTDKGK